MQEPKLTVGIMFEPEINFSLLGKYTYEEQAVSGMQHVAYANGKISWNNNLYDELIFTPQNEKTDAFELIDVTIGIEFHWERKENQRFTGALKIIVENKKLTAINEVPVEDYLTSVISSEMSATASLELLKAHAVISRSWVLAPPPPERGISEQKSDKTANDEGATFSSPSGGREELGLSGTNEMLTRTSMFVLMTITNAIRGLRVHLPKL